MRRFIDVAYKLSLLKKFNMYCKAKLSGDNKNIAAIVANYTAIFDLDLNSLSQIDSVLHFAVKCEKKIFAKGIFELNTGMEKVNVINAYIFS